MREPKNRSVVISGCSGGGKSSLIAELHRRGYDVVEEPGRRIVAEEMKVNGTAVPWMDKWAFLRRAMVMADDDLRSVGNAAGTWTFFDRGLVDAMVALQYAAGDSLMGELPNSKLHYHRTVFLVPPWPEIYVQDAERRHDFAVAKREYAQLSVAYPLLGYRTFVLPKRPVAERADQVLEMLRSLG